MQDHIGFRCAKTPTVPGQEPQRPVRKAARASRKKAKAASEAAGSRPISPDDSMEQIASSHPEHVAKAIRSSLIEDSLTAERRQALGMSDQAEEGGPAASARVAILLLGLGSDLSGDVMRYLNDMEIESIAQAISELDIVTPTQRDEVSEGFRSRILSGDVLLRGGTEFARTTLEKALGPRKMNQVLDRVKSTTTGGFNMLRDVDPHQILPFLSKEHPQTIALILTQLDTAQAAGVLSGLPSELQADVAYRIATIDSLPTKSLRNLEESLEYELQALLSGMITEIGGPRSVAEVLTRAGRATEEAVLERLGEQEPELVEEIRNQSFTFDDIARLTDREIQMVLREADTKDMAVALKGASRECAERIFANYSDDTGKMVKDEMEFSGPVRMSDVEAVQLRIVQIVRRLEKEGQTYVVRGEPGEEFVDEGEKPPTQNPSP